MRIGNRIGIFYVTQAMIEDAPDAIMAVMGKCIVVSCRFIGDRFEYFALSPDFDGISLGQAAPAYSVIIEKIDKQLKVSFARISE